MGAVGLIASLEMRRRGRHAIALALVIGILGAAVLSVLAGARRTGSSLDRFRAQSRSADLELAVAGRPTAGQMRTLERAPSVVATAVFRAVGLEIPQAPELEAIGAPVDHAFGSAVDRGRVVAGRPANPSVPGEIAIGESLAARLHLHVGGTLTAFSYSPQQVAAELAGGQNVGPFAGPRVALKIVGVVRRPLDLSDRAEAGGFLVLSPAFSRAYSGRVGVFGSYIRVRTRGNAAGTAAAAAATRRAFGSALFDTQSLSIETDGARDAIHILAITLWILGAVGAFASFLAVGLLLVREIALISADYEGTNLLGLTRRQRAALCGPFVAIAVGAGTAFAVAGAIALSPLFSIGVARRAEPRLGVRVDPLMLLLGALTLVVVLAGVGFVAATRATRTTDRLAEGPRRAIAAIDALARRGGAPTMTYGLRLAVGTARSRTATAVRSALVGAVIGVLGVTAMSVFTSSLDHLVATPRLYGSTWDFTAADSTTNTRCGGSDFGLAHQAGLASVAEVCSQNVSIDGRATPGVAFTSLRGAAINPEVIDGHAPRGPREVALGTATLRALHKRVGDDVTVSRGATSNRYSIVGRVVLPALGRAEALADGASFTGEGFKPFFDPNLFSRVFVGRFARGANRAAVDARVAAIPQLGPPTGPSLAVEVARVHQVGWLPFALGALFAGLALLAVAHAIVTAVRRRRHDLAVLKALGFLQRQVRAVVAWQAAALAALGVLVGVPLGLVIGRLAWRIIAGDLGVAVVVTIPGVALLITVPVTFVAVSLVAFAPARAAARSVLAIALRSE